MSIIYVPHEVTTLAEVNALALTDRQQNDAIVLSDTGFVCAWTLPYRTRNEGVGRWEYDYDGVSFDSLDDGDKVTVLVPIEAETSTETGLSDPRSLPRSVMQRTIYRTPWENT